MTNESATAEADCPWFDAGWLLDHPDFPLATLVEEPNPEEGNS